MTRLLPILLPALTATAGTPRLESVSLVSSNRVRLHWTGSGQQFQVRCATETSTNVYDVSYVRPGKHEFDWVTILPDGYSAWSVREAIPTNTPWSNELQWGERNQRIRAIPPRAQRMAQPRLRSYVELPPLPGQEANAVWTLTWQYTGPTTAGVVCRVYESVSLRPYSWQLYRTMPAARENALDVLMMPHTFFKVCAFDGVTEHYDWIENLTPDP